MSLRARPGLFTGSRGARRLAPWILGVIGWPVLATAGCGGHGATGGAGGVSGSASSSSTSSVASGGSGLGGGASSSTASSSSGAGGASSSTTAASSSGAGGDSGASSSGGGGGGGAPASDAGPDASGTTDAGSDAGTDSGGASDAGSDGAPGDAGTGSGDGGMSDGGVSDGGVSDGGVSDGGVSDAGASDAGAGDGGALPSCGDTSGLQPGAPWPMRGRCPTRIARADVAGPARANLKWSQAIGASGNPNLNYGSVVSSPVVAADGTIYVGIAGSGTFSGGLLAFAPADGSLLWHYGTGAAQVASGAVVRADGSLVFASSDGTAVALEKTGVKRWSTALGAKSFPNPLVGPDGTLYFGTDSGLEALHADGSVAWSQSPCSLVRGGASLQADGSIVYTCQSSIWVTSSSGVLGTSIGGVEEDQIISGPPTVGPGGAVWYAATTASGIGGITQHATLFSYSPAAGFKYRDFAWEVTAFFNSPALLPNGNAVVGAPYLMNGNKDGIVTAAITGGYTQGPSYPSGIEPQVSVDVDGNMYFVAGTTLVSLGPNGSPRWTAGLDSGVQIGIAIGGDGTLYVGTVDGYLYAFGP